MRLRQAIGIVALLFVLVQVTGCGRLGDPAYGRVVGRVVDEAGQGIADVSISIEGATQRAVTDNEGRFALPAPVGTRVLSAFKAAYTPVKSEGISGATLVVSDDGELQLKENGQTRPLETALTASATVQEDDPYEATIEVNESTTTTLAPIVLFPTFSNIRNVAAYVAEPELSSNLAAGQEVHFRFDVNYAFSSPAAGKVTLYLYYDAPYESSPRVAGGVQLQVSAGSGSRVLAVTATVPNAARLGVLLALTDLENNVLALNKLSGYEVSGYTSNEIVAPTLELVSQGAQGVTFTWHGGNLTDASQMQLVRNITPLEDIFVDMESTTVTDPYPAFDVEATYTLALTQEPPTYTRYSNSVKVTVPPMGITETQLSGNILDILLDKDRDYLYLLDKEYNRVQRIIISSGSFDSSIPVCGVPAGMALSANGAYLAVACAGTNSVAMIDMTALSTQTVRLQASARDVAYNSSNGKFYVASGQQIVILDPVTLQMQFQPLSAFPYGISFSPDGTVIAVQTYRSWLLYKASGFSELGSFYSRDDALFSLDGSRIYSGSSVYSIDNLGQAMGDLPGYFYGLLDGARIIVRHPRGYLLFLVQVGQEWVIDDALYWPRYGSKPALAMDATHFYYVQDGTLVDVDLAAWEARAD